MGNDVYAYCSDAGLQEVIDSQCVQVEKFHGKVGDKNRIIPKLFMIPKFHKRPYKYRFIAGASNATTKQLSKDVNLCLKLIKKVHKGYCKAIQSRNGYNYYWSVDNTNDVIDRLNNVKKPSSIHTYDFSTLYTNLPLDLVKRELFEMIDRYFDINERKSNKFITLNHFYNSSRFESTERKGSYDRIKLKAAIEYLLFNSYVRFGPLVFKQIKGIPMGGNASPLIADLFLANLEFKYMEKLVKSKSQIDLDIAKKVSNNSRFIDDIAVCNMKSNSEFFNYSSVIYPDTIPLTSGIIDNVKDSFLDLDIRIEDGKFVIKVYHKVDDFDFEVVSFPFPTSNISDYITYNSFYSQLVRFSTICSKFADFANRCSNLFNILIQRGFSKSRLKGSFNKFIFNFGDIIYVKYKYDEICRFRADTFD